MLFLPSRFCPCCSLGQEWHLPLHLPPSLGDSSSSFNTGFLYSRKSSLMPLLEEGAPRGAPDFPSLCHSTQHLGDCWVVTVPCMILLPSVICLLPTHIEHLPPFSKQNPAPYNGLQGLRIMPKVFLSLQSLSYLPPRPDQPRLLDLLPCTSSPWHPSLLAECTLLLYLLCPGACCSLSLKYASSKTWLKSLILKGCLICWHQHTPPALIPCLTDLNQS